MTQVLKANRTSTKRSVLNLQEENENLLRSNHDLEIFASKAAHEIKAPLISAISWLNALQGGIAKANDYLNDHATEVIERNLNLSIKIIDDLLRISQLDGDKSPHSIFELRPIVEHLIQIYDSKIKEFGAIIEIQTLPTIKGNPIQIECVFSNLINNALTYKNPAKPLTIGIGSKVQNDHFEIFISDSGVGIPTEKLEEVFEIFKRIPSKLNQPGNGIGLAHCRKVVQLHGGQIWAESNINQGATIKFTIPKHIKSPSRKIEFSNSNKCSVNP